MKKKPSFIFTPYKSLGVHTTAIKPFFFYNVGRKKPYVSLFCPINNSLAEYNAARLRLISVSDCLPADITAVAAKTTDILSEIYVAAGDVIYCLTFCRKIDRIINVGCNVKHMLILGVQLIIIDSDHGVRVIDIESGNQILHLEGSSSFEVTCLMHPATYINKIILGSTDGSLKIINIRTGKTIHQFNKLVDSQITVIEQTPVIDVLTIGTLSGMVLLYNIKTDKKIMSFKHDKAISAVAFRTDDSNIMTTADIGGHIAVWNLDKQELIGKITNVHKGPITRLFFFQNEPIMVSTSADNSIRVWTLDSGDAMPRQLNVLEGHAEPVSAVKFASTSEIITASFDGSVREHSILHKTMRVKLGDAGVMSRATAKKKKRDLNTIKIDPIIDINIGFSREAAWDNILCRHSNSLTVSTWSSRKTSMGKHQLVHPRFTSDSSLFHAAATATCVSSCGNFAFVGYSTGHLDQFNIQSGRLIKSFGEEIVTVNGIEVKTGKAHTAAVTVLAVDSRGNEIISGSTTGELRFWDLKSGRCNTTMRTKLQIHDCTQSPVNSLMAVVCSSDSAPSVAIIDTLCRRVVRTFKNVGNRLTAVSFSSDGRWLFTADSDCYIRIWELSTSQLIDVMLFSKPCIGITFNETGQYFATIHEGEKAIEVWANKKLFYASLNIKALPIDYKPTWDTIVDPDYSMVEDLLINDEEMSDDETIDTGLVSFSGLPPSRWANLPDLALIKERNKPQEPVRKPKQAPFFLTASATLEGFEFDIEQENLEEKRKNILAKRSFLELESSFSSSLRRAKSTDDFLGVFDLLKKMSLSSIDFQIRSLPIDVLSQFFHMLLEVLKTRKDFDLVHAYLATCIKVQHSAIWKNDSEELSTVLEYLSKEIDITWMALNDLFTENAAVTQWVKNALI